MGKKKKYDGDMCGNPHSFECADFDAARGNVGGSYELHMEVKADKAQNIQVYYSPTQALTGKLSAMKAYDKDGRERGDGVFHSVALYHDSFGDLGTEPGMLENSVPVSGVSGCERKFCRDRGKFKSLKLEQVLGRGMRTCVGSKST